MNAVMYVRVLEMNYIVCSTTVLLGPLTSTDHEALTGYDPVELFALSL